MDKPKSVILMQLFFLSMRMFSGFKSRCIMFFLCKYLKAKTICWKYLLAFDLNATEVYQKSIKDDEEKPRASRTPTFPADWQNQFGMPYYEHKQTMQINVFDGYAIYSVKETKKGKSITPALPPANIDTKDENIDTEV